MKDIESLISPLIKSQFPEFYQEEGPRFIDFVRLYYAWMEAQDGAVNASRRLFDYRDIDKTAPEFVTHFKQKYLDGVPLTSSANTQLLTKHSLDLYRSKGTEASIKLVIQGMFNEEAKVYFPGDDVFKTSDGDWVKPQYLELNISERTKTFVGREIVGNSSGAKAFLEALVRRRIGTKFVEVAYLSNLRGDFQTGEYITETTNTVLQDAPKVVGSMTTLTVVGGGANFAVGDIFEVSSSNGKQGRARVAEISNQTGTVNFIYINPLTSGGWGYSLAHANVIVSSKVLVLSNINNANTLITGFNKFERVTQNLANISYTTARPNNANYTVGAVIENYYSNGDVSANAVIVTATASNATSGYIIVAPYSGNVATVDSTFAVKGTGTSTTFNANSGVANATDIITTSSAHGLVNNDIVIYKLLTGNTVLSGLSDGAAYYVVNAAAASTLQLSNTLGGASLNLTAGLNQTGHILVKSLGSGVVSAYTNRTASGNVVGSNSTSNTTGYLGLADLSSNGFLITPYANIVGTITNTTATVANVSTGTGATFSLSLLTDTESVFLSPDFLNSNNTQNVVFNTINLNGNNSGAPLQYGSPQALAGGGFAYGGFGFVKFPGSNMDSILLDCLRFDATTIGSIASITGINPGSNYNLDPFVTVVDTYVMGYGRRDYTMSMTPLLGAFIPGEQIQQTYSSPAVQLTITGFTGTYANGVAASTVALGELVYQSNSTANAIASGYVLESGITAGSGTMKLANVTGTFVNTGNVATQMRSLSSGATANITAVSLTTYATTARALVKEVSNSSFLTLKRINLENTFQTGLQIIGRSSGATANVVNVLEDPTTVQIGLNANIAANVQTSNDVVTSLTVYDSGFGYINRETVTLVKDDSAFQVTAIVELGKQGVGAGFFSTSKGFLDSDKRVHDGEYYQTYSYEVQTKIPYDRYVDVMKKLAHVAGTRMFGRVEAISVANVLMTAINSIEIS